MSVRFSTGSTRWVRPPRAASGGDIERATELLAQRPIGRPGRIAGTYEKSVIGQPYIIAYALLPRDDGQADDILILQVIHTSRDWPSGRWPQ